MRDPIWKRAGTASPAEWIERFRSPAKAPAPSPSPRPVPVASPRSSRLDAVLLPILGCDYRVPLVVGSEVAPQGCGCRRPAFCLMGKAHRPDGLITESDCASCVRPQ